MAKIDRHSETWRALNEWAIEAEAEYIRILRSHACTDDETRSLRGKLELIDEIKGLTEDD